MWQPVVFGCQSEVVRSPLVKPNLAFGRIVTDVRNEKVASFAARRLDKEMQLISSTSKRRSKIIRSAFRVGTQGAQDLLRKEHILNHIGDLIQGIVFK